MNRPEAWLRGPIEGVPDLLQPVAHALVQARDEIETVADAFPDALLWDRPGGVASVGFHLQHVTGVIDRLFTYARDDALNERQRAALGAEGTPVLGVSGRALARAFGEQVEVALAQLRATDVTTLTDTRHVGRARLPSTVLGLLFHAAEHVQRHTGQLLVTARILQAGVSG